MMSNALKTSILTIFAYLCFYTGYDKQSRQLNVKQLLKILLFDNGIDATLVELNKAISLAGLTCLCLSFLIPHCFHMNNSVQYQNTLYFHSEIMLIVHSIYSLFKYYNTKNIPNLKEWSEHMFWHELLHKRSQMIGIKKVSIILGIISQVTLFMGYSHMLTEQFAMFFAILMGTFHFYFMEIDYKFKLQVRPFAFLPLILAAAVGMIYMWKT